MKTMPLREARRRRLLTLEKLAAAAGLSTKTIWDIEKENGSTPRLDTISRICNVLEVSPLEVTEFADVITGKEMPAHNLAA